MYLIFADFSENNLLTAQLGISSLYELKICDKTLAEYLLSNFIGASAEKVFLVDCAATVKNDLLDVFTLSEGELYKKLQSVNDSEKVCIVKNSVYFEGEIYNNDIWEKSGFYAICDKSNNPFCVISTADKIRQVLNEKLSLRSLFRLSELNPLNSQIFSGYMKNLSTVNDYKALLKDIINSKTAYKPPFVAEGIYIENDIPKGDFSVNPPVYFGSGVQIEGGAVIGPDTVIYGNSLIAENSVVKNSVLNENVYISSGCYVDGAVCCNNASLKRNSAVFSGSVIGSDALIGEGVTVENNSVINENTRLDGFDTSPFFRKSDFGFFNKLQGLFPDKAALLGSAFAVAFKRPKILVAGDGQINSLSLKLAFIGGFVASGGECIDAGVLFKSQILFSSAFCECEYAVFFSGSQEGTDVTIFNSHFRELNKSEYSNLLSAYNAKNISYVKSGECKNIRQIRGLSRMYVREIIASSEKELPYIEKVICENARIKNVLEDILKSCDSSRGNSKGFSVYINKDGTKTDIVYEGVFYRHKQLKRIVFFYLKSSNYKFFECDIYKELWKADGIILLLHILNIIKQTNKSPGELISDLPDFYIKGSAVTSKLSNRDIAEKISRAYPVFFKNNCYNIVSDRGFVKIKRNKSGNIKVLCAAESMSLARELCDFFGKLLQ